MSNKLNPCVPVKIGGEKRRLKFTLGAVRKFQELTGVDILMSGLNILDMDEAQFHAFIYCGLFHEDEKLTPEKTARIINKKNAIELITASIIAINAAMPDPKPKNEAGDGSTSPEKNKPTDWLELWSIGRHYFKLKETEFWQLTLAQFTELLMRLREDEEKEDFRTAVIASNILNTIPRTEETKYKIYTPADIFPHYGWGMDSGEPDEDDIRMHYKEFALANGGESVEKQDG